MLEMHWLSYTLLLIYPCCLFNPLGPRPPTLLPYRKTPDLLVAASQWMLHTSISAYANRNRILARLVLVVALFPLLFITSGDVFCSKFCEVWETLWIFKVVRWMRDRCPLINKSPTVSNGVGASSFVIWTANLAQSLTVSILTNSQNFIFGDLNWKFCKVSYPIGPPNLTFRCKHFWLGISF